MTTNNNSDFNLGFHAGFSIGIGSCFFIMLIVCWIIHNEAYEQGLFSARMDAIKHNAAHYEYDESTQGLILIYDQKTPTAEANPK